MAARGGGRANSHRCHAGPNCAWLAQEAQARPKSVRHIHLFARAALGPKKPGEAAASARARANDSRCRRRRRRWGNGRVFIGTAPSVGDDDGDGYGGEKSATTGGAAEA